MEPEQFRSEVEAVFAKLINLSKTYRESANVKSDGNALSTKIFVRLAVAPFLIAALLTGIALWLNKRPDFQLTVMILITACYIGIIAFQVTMFIEGWPYLKRSLVNPLKVVLERSKEEIIIDYTVLCGVTGYSINVLSHVHRHLVVERGAYERRVGLLVGALEKVGLIPSFITLYLGYTKADQNEFYLWLAAVALILYAFALYSHLVFIELDRCICTMEQIIKTKEDQRTALAA